MPLWCGRSAAPGLVSVGSTWRVDRHGKLPSCGLSGWHLPPEISRPRPAVIALDDRMRAEARDRLRKASMFFISIDAEDGYRGIESTWASPDTLGFFFTTIAVL